MRNIGNGVTRGLIQGREQILAEGGPLDKTQKNIKE